MITRGGQGTAEGATYQEYYDALQQPHIWVPKDIHPLTALNIRKLLQDMNEERHKNHSLEKAREDKKRSASQTTDEERKKRITAAMVMSEQQMFQEEHLKLQQEVSLLRSQMNKTIRVLNSLQQRFQEHISLDSNGATPVASTTPSLGASCPDDLSCLDWSDWDCNCPDNLACPVHPDKKKKQ